MIASLLSSKKFFAVFFRGAAILSSTSAVSYGLGLVRDRLLASHFGAGAELDVYNAAFIVPDLILNIFVAGALQAAFVPLYSELQKIENRKHADKFASTVLTGALLLVLIIGIPAAIFMPWLASFIAPGISGADKTLLVQLSRLLLLSPLIFAISNTLGGMLVSKKSYLAYGLSPVLYNLGIVGGIMLLAPRFGIYGVVIGTVIGGVMHLLVRLLGIWRKKFRYKPSFDWRESHARKLIALMIPKMVGHPVEQLSFLGFTMIASTLAVGSISTLSFARNFMSVPVSLFGIAFATAVFPLLSEDVATQSFKDYKKHLVSTIQKILLFTIPSAVVLFALSKFLITFLIGSGRFGPEAIDITASLLSIFALSIPLESTIHVLARGFYAFKNTFIPVSLAILGLVIMVSTAWLLARTIGIQGLAWGYFCGSLTEVLLLGFILRNKLSQAQAQT